MAGIWWIALAAVLVASCQPLPRPFGRDAGDAPNPLLGLSDARGVTVVGIDGAPAPMARALRAAMAAALRARNIPASTTATNRHGLFLIATADARPAGGDRVRVALRWEVLDGEGEVAGRHRQHLTLGGQEWRRGGAAQARKIVGAAAPAIAAIVQEPAPAAAAAPDGRLFVAPVAGGPEAANRALGRAVARALAAEGFAVAANRDPDALVVAGTVNIGAAVQGRRRVEVVWTVLGRDNVALGTVAQRNSVASTTLRDGWERLAPTIARGAVAGMRDLLRRLTRSRANHPGRGGG